MVYNGVRAIHKFGHIEPQTFAAELLQKLFGDGDMECVCCHFHQRLLLGVDVVRRQVARILLRCLDIEAPQKLNNRSVMTSIIEAVRVVGER